MAFIIRQPETSEDFRRYYHLRWKLLRKPWKQPPGTETDAMEAQCIHFMAIDNNNEVIGVCRLQFNSPAEAQIRYMAVSDEHQGQGIGAELIRAAETRILKTSCRTIVLDAREPAVGFYLKSGYKITAKSYLLFNEIQHYRMQKQLL